MYSGKIAVPPGGGGIRKKWNIHYLLLIIALQRRGIEEIKFGMVLSGRFAQTSLIFSSNACVLGDRVARIRRSKTIPEQVASCV
jgi:hypothetical protein